MKKLLILFLALVSVLMFVACSSEDGGGDGDNAGQTPPPVHECEWEVVGYNQMKHTFKCKDSECGKTLNEEHDCIVEVEEFANSLEAVKKCTKCEYTYEADKNSVTPNKAQQTLDSLFDCTIITLGRGNYGLLKIVYKNDVIIYAGNSVVVDQIVIDGNCKNIFIYNVSFDNVVYPEQIDGGINLNANGSQNLIENVVIKDCKFTNSTGILTDTSCYTKNVKVIDCEFKDIYRCNWNGYRKVICLWRYDGLVIEICIIDGTYGDAICVGNYASGGELIIRSNIFKGVTSRTMRINVSDATFVDISSNIFYKEHCSMNEDPYLAHEEGVYIYSPKSVATIGINTWEVLPENIDLFLFNVNIDMSAQKLLNEQN